MHFSLQDTSTAGNPSFYNPLDAQHRLNPLTLQQASSFSFPGSQTTETRLTANPALPPTRRQEVSPRLLPYGLGNMPLSPQLPPVPPPSDAAFYSSTWNTSPREGSYPASQNPSDMMSEQKVSTAGPSLDMLSLHAHPEQQLHHALSGPQQSSRIMSDHTGRVGMAGTTEKPSPQNEKKRRPRAIVRRPTSSPA